MIDILIQNGLEAEIEERDPPVSDADWKKLDRRTICLCLSNNVMQEIHTEKTTINLQRKLGALYLSKSITSQLVLKQHLCILQMVEGTSIKTHISEFIDLINDLKTVDAKVDD